MKELVSTPGCKRKLILNYFGHDLIQNNSMPVHSCCDNDAAACDCDERIGIKLSDQLQESSLVETNIPGDEDDCSKLLSISYAQKVQIRNALEKRMQTLHFAPLCVGGMSLATGFTPSLVNKTIECCEQLVFVEAIEHLLPVFSKENATMARNWRHALDHNDMR